MFRFVGGWRLLILEKWIIDLAIVINECNAQSVWTSVIRQGDDVEMRCAWCFQDGTMIMLLNDMNVSKWVTAALNRSVSNSRNPVANCLCPVWPHPPLCRACAPSSAQSVNLHSFNACGGSGMLDRSAPCPVSRLVTLVWVGINHYGHTPLWPETRRCVLYPRMIFCDLNKHSKRNLLKRLSPLRWAQAEMLH